MSQVGTETMCQGSIEAISQVGTEAMSLRPCSDLVSEAISHVETEATSQVGTKVTAGN